MPIQGHSLPYFVELLRTLGWERQVNLVGAGTTQVVIPVFPPNTKVDLQLVPTESNYCNVYYAAALGDDTMPNALTFKYRAWGSTLFSGTLTSGYLGTELEFLVPTFHNQPTDVTIANTTALAQRIELNTKTLIINTEDDYKVVVKALQQRGTSAKTEEELEKIVQLLAKFTGQRVGG